MTDKEKLSIIKAEIDKRVEKYGYSSEYSSGKATVYREIRSFINSIPEEPVSEDLEEAGREWLRPQLDKYYVCYGETKMMELTRFDGYAMLDAIEFGAQWQKQRLSVEHGKELLYVCNKTAERTKREVINKAAGWLDENLLNYWSQAYTDGYNFIEDFRKYMEE